MMSTLIQFDNLADLSEFNCPIPFIVMHPFVMFDWGPEEVIGWLESENFSREDGDFMVWQPYDY
jgi:hypothetical protein